MNLSKLKLEKIRLDRLIGEKIDIANEAPEVVSARKDAENAEKKYSKVLERKIEELCGNLEKELENIEKQIKETENKEKEKIPSHIRDILNGFLKGTNYGRKPFAVKWVSPKERFFILTKPGSTFWANMGEPNKYCCAEHYLMDCQKANHLNGIKFDNKKFTYDGSILGFNLYNKLRVEYYEGRLIKEIETQWIARAIEEEGVEEEGEI